MIRFRNYQKEDYQLLCDFLITLNEKNKEHINWNWARLEWMIAHPNFDKSIVNDIGLWFDEDRLVATAIFDMYHGEASALSLPNYEYLFEEVIDYAYQHLKDENGLGIAVNNINKEEIRKLISHGFAISEQKETIMRISLEKEYDPKLKEGFSFYNINPKKDIDDIEWVIYQGFDHGDDKEEFEKQRVPLEERKHANPYLHLMIENKDKEKVAFCSMWYDKKTSYAYLEPLVVIPKYRKMGLGKSIVYALCNRCKELGAKEVFVISDQEFYKKIGFRVKKEYTFYWKK